MHPIVNSVEWIHQTESNQNKSMNQTINQPINQTTDQSNQAKSANHSKTMGLEQPIDQNTIYTYTSTNQSVKTVNQLIKQENQRQYIQSISLEIVNPPTK